MTTPRTPTHVQAGGLRPALSETRAAEVLEQEFGRTGVLTSLPSERDQNFRVTFAEGGRAVLKISHPTEQLEALRLQHDILSRLGRGIAAYEFPTPLTALDGSDVTRIDFGDDTLWVRLLSWVEGGPLAAARPKNLQLLHSLGDMLGTVDSALTDLDLPSARRHFQWDLRHAPEGIATNSRRIQDPERRAIVDRLVAPSIAALSAFAPDLRSGLIHGDANDHNVMVTDVDGRPARAETRVVTGLIDFGDACHSWIVAEPAIACAYAMLDISDPIAAAREVTRGYHGVNPLTEQEIAALPHLILLRLLVSVAISAAQRAEDPGNAYLSVSEAPAWRLLSLLDGESTDWLHFVLRGACGFEPWPGKAGLVRWLRDAPMRAHPVLDPAPAASARILLDLSVEGTEWGSDVENLNTSHLTRRLFGRMADTGALVGIGRYDEARGWYDGPAYSEPGGSVERRTIHLGVDLFVEAGTAVRAPFDAVVHSVRNNDADLDYGPTLVLEHRPEGVPPFFTLYGHLGPAVLDQWQPGDAVTGGQVIAEIGDFPDNGNWPPHLHFQVIGHLLGRSGEFPGVGSPTDRDVWLSLCPDPNLILEIPDLEPAGRGDRQERLLELRRRFLGPSLSVAYSRPLKIVRGSGQVLVDDLGRRYLDCVNNVAHVGHSHPRVVAAAAKQMGVLNTNTRYLHDNLVAYAQRLVATLPDPLSVCFLVCSGSEANELALRMARTHTGTRDVVVLDGAYHGNTSSLVDLSPYKFAGPGGGGAPGWVHVAPMPDTYRGRFRAEDGQAGIRYADALADVLAEMTEHEQRPAALFCESILSCGGQIVMPDGYLARSVEAVRQAGGLYVADEVQVGFGRVGSHFWGFECEGVVPDIVTLGKPIGNGHPLGAVVTTPEVAASFDNGMEYFNTFGGNPVSCAVGIAVLDVIRDQGLQDHAKAVGDHLLAGLRKLADRHELIGDVRGRGLFIGVEFVTDRTERTPAAAHCRYLVERMRDCGILLSTDGPDHNVIKIKPPLVFAFNDANRVVKTFDQILGEDAFRPTR